MQISALFIRVVILVLPGLVGSLFYRKLRGGRQQKDWRDLAEITLFALSSYALYGAALELFAGEGPVALRALFDESVPVRWTEVVVASFISVGLAVLVSYVNEWKLINRFGKYIGATWRYGDEDVWEHFHNSSEYGRWVFVRDHKLDLVYFGWIDTFSESGAERELLISDVEVYSNEDGERLYDVPVLYVARDRHDFTIEVPSAEPEETEEST